MPEKCMNCQNDALIIHDNHEFYCGQCWMRKEFQDAQSYESRSRTFTSSQAGGRTLSGRIPSNRYKAS